MKTKNTQIKIVEGLCVYITELDHYRPPVTTGIFPYPWNTFFDQLFSQNQRNYFIRNNGSLYEKTRKELKPYFKHLRKYYIYKVSVPMFFFLLLWVFLVSGVGFILFNMGFNFLYSFLLAVIVDLPILYLILTLIFTRIRRIAGEKYNADIKIAVQELIDYGIELIRNEELDPNDFPIKITHNDYKGLTYEIKGKNNYIDLLKDGN